MLHANGDRYLDLLIAGNFYGPQPETGRFDGGVGLLLHGNGDGSFVSVPAHESGIIVPGDAKATATADLDGNGTLEWLVTNNDAAPQVFKRGQVIDGISLKRVAPGQAGLIVYPDGKRQRWKAMLGSGYLSQSQPAVQVPAGGEFQLDE